MRTSTFLLLLLSFIYSSQLNAQNCPSCNSNACGQIVTSFEFPDGTNFVCDGAVKTVVNESDTTNLSFAVWCWQDGTPNDTVFSNFYAPFSHQYNVLPQDICDEEQTTIDVKLTLFRNCPGGFSCNSATIALTIIHKPKADFEVETDICVGDQVCFEDAGCNGEDYLLTINPGNITYTTAEPCHTFTTGGTYTVTRTVTNDCGSDVHTVTMQVYELPIADAAAEINGSLENDPDTILVCLGPSNSVVLNGQQFSQNETTWNWDIITSNGGSVSWNPPTMNFPFDESNVQNPTIIFNNDGIYVLELTVSNPCGAIDKDILIFNVVESPSAQLNLNETDCTPITLNPSDFLTINGNLTGCAWDFGAAGTSNDCDPDNITFTQTTTVIFQGFNECSTITISDTITITQSGQAIITSPCPDTLCTDDAPCVLSANIPGGAWTLNGNNFNGTFNPATAAIGLNTIVYGAPPCIQPAQEQIFVISSEVDISGPVQVCIDGGTVTYTATPTGGSFSASSGAINPVTGVYDPAVAGAGPDTIFYQTAGNSFCQGNASLPIQVVDLVSGFEVVSCDGLEICFDTTPNTSNYNSILWNFGDGQTSAQQPIVCHTFPSASIYNVTVTITAGACSASFTDAVTVVEPPSANFNLSYLSPACGPLSVAVNDLSTGDDLTYSWNIGGTTIAGPDPGPITLNNTAIISLTVSNDCGSSTYSETVEVEPSPMALFGANQYVCSGETLDVFNNSMFYTSLLWDFGNGQVSTDTGALQQVVYFTNDDNDTVTITLIASGICPPDTFSQDVIVVPTDAQAFVTTTAAPLFQVCQNEQVCFESFSLPSGVPLQWDFGDGNTTTGFNVCHVWEDTGVYKVVSKLVSCGFDSTITTITVLPIPAAAFELPSTGCPGKTLLFENTSVGAISYHWIFGDGDSSTIVSPSHAYDSAGIYEVCLIALSANGCRDTVCQDMEISAQPTPSFSFDNPGCQGDNVVFTNTTPNVASCSWDFDNGDFSADCNPTAVFDLPGNYNVTLTVTSPVGCTASTSQIVLVGERPIPSFTFVLIDTCHPATVVFTNTSQLADGYEWDFGDGATATATSPQHVYTSPGTYTVTLTAIADGVCTAVASQNLTVEETPVANISLAQNERCFGEAFPFQNASTGSISNLEWDFGDGLFSFEGNPTHTYTDTGSFQVVLTVFNGSVCKASDTLEVTVHPPVLATAEITDVPCFGDTSGEINITISSGTPVFEFDWSNGAVTEDIPNLPTGNYTLLITDSNGCTWDSTMAVQQPPVLVLTQVSEQVVTCAGGADGGLCVEASGGVGGYVIVWENGVTGDCITNMAAGVYAVTLTDSNGCELIDGFEVRENPPLEITDSVKHRPCFGVDSAFIRIDAVQGGIGWYSLVLEGDNGFLETGYNFGRLRPGPYHLTVTDSLGCTLQKNYLITEPDSIWLNVQDDSIDLKLGADTILFIDHNLGLPSFTWSPPTWLDCADCPEPLARPFDDVTYLLTMTDANGCTVTDRVAVQVEKDRTIFIPNTFTPNQDGRNDVFRIRVGVKSVEQVNIFQVTDRWGEVVFEAKNFDPTTLNSADAWDGKFRGELLPPDNYYYAAHIRYVDGVEQLFEGNITLIR